MWAVHLIDYLFSRSTLYLFESSWLPRLLSVGFFWFFSVYKFDYLFYFFTFPVSVRRLGISCCILFLPLCKFLWCSVRILHYLLLLLFCSSCRIKGFLAATTYFAWRWNLLRSAYWGVSWEHFAWRCRGEGERDVVCVVKSRILRTVSSQN